MVAHSDRSRAQLILVGALLLATVIIGLSMLLNSLIFTGAAGDTRASAAIEETDFIEYDVEQGVRELVVRLNHDTRHVTQDELGDDVERNVRRFSRALGEARARTGSIAVSVEYDNASSEFGGRIVQDHNADMSDTDGDDHWNLVKSADNARIGWFSLSADLENTSDTTPFIATARASGDIIEIRLKQNNTDPSKLDVQSDYPGGSENVVCEADRGRVLIDLYSGTGFTDNCSFHGFGSLDRPTELKFDNVDALHGKYAVVTNRTHAEFAPRYDHCDGLPENDAEPCIAPALWSANVTTTVEGGSISYDDSYNLTVYTNER